jgi:hypothetical protein
MSDPYKKAVNSRGKFKFLNLFISATSIEFDEKKQNLKEVVGIASEYI